MTPRLPALTRVLPFLLPHPPQLHKKAALVGRPASFCLLFRFFRSGLAFGFHHRFPALEISRPAFAFDRLVRLFAHISLYFAFVFRFCVSTMVIRPLRFNIYLPLCLALVVLTGCQSAESKHHEQLATVRVYLASNTEMADLTEVVSVSRATPISVRVVKSPFLNEGMLAAASLVEEHGGFALKLEFNNFGRTILEQYSATYQGQRFAIRSQFGVEPDVVDRWLGAPRIPRRIKDGVLIFTPDADRAEAEQIVIGLNNHAKKSGEQMKP